MNKTIITDLIPQNSSRKSFYGKAKVIESNGSHYLESYNTIVASVDKNNKVHRYWNDSSQTTSSHLNSFLSMFDCDIKSAKEFNRLDCEKFNGLTIRI